MYKLWRFAYSRFGDEICPEEGLGGHELDETLTAPDAYTDEELAKIKKSRFSCIGVHGLLRHLVNVEPFRELGTESPRHIDSLRSLISKSEAHGIKVFIHMQLPRALRADCDEFWSSHPDAGGEEDTLWDSNAKSNVRVRRLYTSSPGVKAWEIFSRAMYYYYPFTIAFLCHGSQNHTLSYGEMYSPRGLSGNPAGRSWKFDERGDDLSNSYLFRHTKFSLDDIIERLGKLAVAWNEGVEILRAATENCRGREALDEFGNAFICGRIWQSTENTYRVFKLRRDWADSNRVEFFRLIEDELRIFKEVLPYVERDPRQGYHAEPHGYMFDAAGINKKISELEKIRRNFQTEDYSC